MGVTVNLLAAACVFLVGASAGEPPVGHLQPFGHHKPPSVIVDEFTNDNAPRPQEFYEKYVKHSKAAIFRGALVDTKAFNLWTDEYIRENFGEMEVRLEAKHEKKHLPPVGEKYLGRDTLRHFADTYHSPGNNVYIVSDLPEPMYRDFGVIPSLGACGEMAKRIVETDIWWSGGGSSSIIHKDAYHQINCLLNGTKYWKLIEYKYEKDIYKHPEPERELGGFSDINPQKVDLIKQPKVADVEWSNFTIHAGDCLFLPKSYYHQVGSSGTHNLAVSLLFARFDERDSLDFSDCTEDTDYGKFQSLADVGVQLVWKGTGDMVMGRADLEDGYRAELLELAKEVEKRGKVLDYNMFKEHLDDVQDEIMMRIGDIRKGWEALDKNGDGFTTTEEVKSLTIDDLRKMGNEIEPFEPSNSYEFEYSMLSFEKVWWMIKNCLKHFKILNKPTWLKYYKRLGGSINFGTEVFDRLGGGKAQIVSKDIGKDDIWYALENWVKYWAPQYSSLTKKPKKEKEGQLWDWAEEEGDLGEGEDGRGGDEHFDMEGENAEKDDVGADEARSRNDEL